MGGRFAAAALALAALAAEGAAEEVRAGRGPGDLPSGTPDPRGWSLRAAAREDWRLRAGSDPAAHDQKGHLALDLGAHHPGDRLAFTGAVDAWWDLDGPPAPGASATALPTVWDRRNPWIDVLALAVDWRPRGSLRRLRAGRQETSYGVPATFDGASVLAQPAGPDLELFALGGRAVHFFRIAPGELEDWIGSAGAAWRASPGLRLEADYRLTRERVTALGATPVVTVSHGYGVAARWRAADALRGKVFARGLGGRVAQAGAALSADLPGALVLQASGTAQPATLRDVSELENPYFAILGESRPFARGSLDLSRTFVAAAGTFGVQAGWQGRAVLSGPEGPFNRSSGRAFVLGSGTRLAGTGLFASASLERVGDDATLSGTGLWAVDGAAGWERRALRVEVGSAYQRWRYTYYRDAEETADVRSFWAEARWRATRALSVRARVTRDVSSSALDTVFVGAAQAFE